MPALPEVLRTEPQFRLLFAGQVLSLVGDRVMLVALPFAVLEAGGGVGVVGLVVVACLMALRPRVVADATEEAPPAFLAAVHAGWREVRSRRWILAGLGAMCAYHSIVLPAVFVLGPVSVSERLGGPGAWAAVAVAFGIGSVIGDLLLLRIRPRHALRVAGIALIAASCQAAVYGSGLPAGPIAAAVGTQATLLAMSAIGVACALAFLGVREVRELPRVSEAQPVG